MHQYKKVALALAVALSFSVSMGSAFAQKKQTVAAEAALDPQLEAVKELLSKNVRDAQIPVPAVLKVERTPIDNIFEAQLADGNIVYFDAKANYLMIGTLLEIKNRENLTQKKIDILSKINWKDLNFKNAIKEVRGKGQRQMVIFSDPNCPYCKKIEQEIEKMDNVTVFTFLVPILSADSKVKSESIWCAKDRKKAYKDWMLNNTTPERKECKSPIDENSALAKNIKVQSTPTIYFPNGERSVGWVEAKALEERLVKGQVLSKK